MLKDGGIERSSDGPRRAMAGPVAIGRCNRSMSLEF